MHRLYLSFLLASASMFLVAPDSSAQGINVDPSKLPKADKFYKHRLKIDILDERPEVTDHRRAPAAPNTYFIPIAPLAAPAGQHTVLPVSGGSGGTVPGGVIVDGNSLPVADFESNMRSLKSPRKSLPATRSGGVPTPAVNRDVSGRVVPTGKNRPRNSRPSAGQSKVMGYERPANSGYASDSSSVKVKVQGELKSKPKKYSILKNSQ